MATLKQMQAKLKKLQAQAERLIANRAQTVLDDIRAMMEKHGLTTADIDRHGRKVKRAAKPQVTLPAPAGRHQAMTKLAKKGKLPAKYRNPKTGETWSGWARPPAWIANVKDRSKFLIDAEGAENAVKPKAAGKKAAAKKTAVKAAKTAQKSAPAAKKKAAAPAAPRKRAAKAATNAPESRNPIV
ncbi:histidine biosynthesis protein [Caballeronia megalochromosomata]|jgi:DNA-binding protein H-NS|nr:histidine biosynthesis protein [Caballeronia megalochromosomata]